MFRLLPFCLLLGIGPLLASCTAAPAYTGQTSDHFDGTHFANRQPMKKTAGDMLRLGWGALSEAAEWPEWVEIEQQKVPRERVDDSLSVTFINHATFLIQVDGLNILTDPVYSERVSPSQLVGPRRVHAPGVRLEDLPPIDVILISHNHYDHLDEATLKTLLVRPGEEPVIIAGLGNGKLLSTFGSSRHRDLDWEQGLLLGGVEFIFTECRHRSGRGITDQMKTLWGSFVIKTSRGHLYFAGDTGYGPHLAATGERHGPFALSLLPIGAYEPRWFMKDVHLNPAEAVQAHLDLDSAHSIGIHFGTFQLSYEAIDQPVIELNEALADAGISGEIFRVLRPGETWAEATAKIRKQRDRPADIAASGFAQD